MGHYYQGGGKRPSLLSRTYPDKRPIKKCPTSCPTPSLLLAAGSCPFQRPSPFFTALICRLLTRELRIVLWTTGTELSSVPRKVGPPYGLSTLLLSLLFPVCRAVLPSITVDSHKGHGIAFSILILQMRRMRHRKGRICYLALNSSQFSIKLCPSWGTLEWL